MKCGKGHDHSSIAEVKACYASQPRTAAPSIPTISDNQHAFILALMEQVGEEPGLTMIDGMTREEASKTIDRLQIKKADIRATQTTEVAPQRGLPANIKGSEVPQGIYTVVFGGDILLDSDEPMKQDRITLRFRDPKWGKWKGTQLVGYLSGPNNDSDYHRCANRTADGYRVWSGFKPDSNISYAIRFLVGVDDALRQEAGMTYALASGNCCRCGRTLTVPASINRGMGPECASRRER